MFFQVLVQSDGFDALKQVGTKQFEHPDIPQGDGLVQRHQPLKGNGQIPTGTVYRYQPGFQAIQMRPFPLIFRMFLVELMNFLLYIFPWNVHIEGDDRSNRGNQFLTEGSKIGGGAHKRFNFLLRDPDVILKFGVPDFSRRQIGIVPTPGGGLGLKQ